MSKPALFSLATYERTPTLIICQQKAAFAFSILKAIEIREKGIYTSQLYAKSMKEGDSIIIISLHKPT